MWQTAEFWGILDGRKLWHDRAVFTDQAYQITVRFLVEPDFAVTVMVAALYTLYGLWNIQQVQQQQQKKHWRPLPVRISIKNFLYLETKVDCLALDGHIDVKAILTRMKTERAFYFTVFDVPALLGHNWRNEDCLEQDRASGNILDPQIHDFVSLTRLD